MSSESIKNSEGTYKNNQQEGLWLYYETDGSLIEEKTYSSGKLNGRSTKWQNLDSKEWEKFYKNGLLSGPSTNWNNSGYRINMTTFKKDLPEGPWMIWYLNSDQIKEQGFHQRSTDPYTGKTISFRDGLTTSFYDDGGKQKEGYLKLNKPEGIWTYWNAKGKEDFKFDYGEKLEHVGWSKIKTVDNIYFKIDNEKPFTGVIADENQDEGYLFLGRTLYGKKEGPWIKWYNSKDVPEVVLIDVPDPEPNLPWSGGKVEKGEWKDGKKHGDWVYWYDNEHIKSKGSYDNGVMSGLWDFYYDNGSKEKQGSLLNGNANGQWIFYNESEEIIQQGTFLDGVKEGAWIAFFNDGRLTEGIYKAGKKDGQWTSWWAKNKNKKEMQGMYKKGKMVDKWYFYNNKGDLKEIRYFSPLY